MSDHLTRRALLSLLTLPASFWVDSADAQSSTDSYLRQDYLERADKRDPDAFFRDVLARKLPGLVQLWLIPPNLLVSTVRQPRWHYVHNSERKLRTASFLRQVDSHEAVQLSRDFPDAVCDPGQPLFAFRTQHSVSSKTLVLGMPHQPSGVRLGFKHVPIPAAIIERYLPSTSAATLTLSEGLIGPQPRYPLSFSATYGKLSQQLTAMTIALHRSDWTLTAKKHIPVRAWCDGCAIPTFDRGLAPVFGVVNLMQLDGLDYPLIIADRSSIESRTIELNTFTKHHLFAEHVLSSYVIGCPSFQTLMQEQQPKSQDR